MDGAAGGGAGDRGRGPGGGRGRYEAKLLAQSPHLTLESGQDATSYFDAQNVGTATWTNDVVRLGTTNPRDRTSAFANSTWLNAGRATPLDRSFAEPGRSGRFTENNAENWPSNGVFLRYTVLPAAPPSVAIASLPEHVPQGTPVTVRANAPTTAA